MTKPGVKVGARNPIGAGIGTAAVPLPHERLTRYCSIESCDRRHHAQGLCATHCARFLEHGDLGHSDQRHWTAAEDAIAGE